MKLFLSRTSPYVRKVRLVLAEKQLGDRVEEIMVNPWQSPPELTALNPLSQVPLLLTGDGEAFYDSPVICQLLDDLYPQPRLLPVEALARARVLRMQALADGVTDAAVNVRLARMADEDAPDAPQTARQLQKIRDGVDTMQKHGDELQGDLHLGTICFAASLGYIDFRFPEIDWRADAPRLASWFEAFSQRPSMIASALADIRESSCRATVR